MTKGVVYSRWDSPSPFHTAEIGQVIDHGFDKPPWIVVDRHLASVIVAGFPGTLTDVEVLVRSSDQPSASASYVRCVSVRVLGHRALHELFGPHGPDVVAVLDRARVLTPEVAERLSAALQPSTEAIYSEGWNRWLRAIEPENVHAGNPHDNTIGVFTKHPKADTEVGFSRSPVGSGLSVVSSLVFNQARAASAARVDEDGEWMMEQPWKRAQSAMLYATMAFGAPHLFSAAEHVQLLTAYTHAFGDLGP